MRTRRILAKLIDMVAFAGFMSLGVRWFDSSWAGFAFGAAYLLSADALGMSAKNWFSLAVVDVNTGRRCSLLASVVRNTPWLAAPLFRTALVEFGGPAAPASGSLAYDVTRGAIGVTGLVVTLSLWRGLGDGSGRHWADVWAATRVVSLKPGEATRAPRGRASAGSARSARATPVDRDAPDFDDADERPQRAPKPRTRDDARGRERDAVDFDDAN